MSIEGGKISLGTTHSVEQQMAGNRQGFTLIEVVIVAVVLAILATVAIPRYSEAKNKAYLAAMAADLHVAAIYEEQYAADNRGQYFSGTATPDAPINGFKTSKDITVTLTAFNILGSQLGGWIATAKHSQSPESCEMRSGIITCTTDNSLTTGVLPPN